MEVVIQFLQSEIFNDKVDVLSEVVEIFDQTPGGTGHF